MPKKVKKPKKLKKKKDKLIKKKLIVKKKSKKVIKKQIKSKHKPVKVKMGGKYTPQVLRGMKDILPEEVKTWDYLLKKTTDLAEAYGFKKIMVPVLEEQMLFIKSTGLTSDIVEKQMYQFTDRSGTKVVMRPEFTPSIVRAYIEQGMFNLSQPVKLFCFGPLFRYERPQAGRYRQLHQFNLEILGSEKASIDAQIILFSQALFNTLGIQTAIQVNSLGCPECRKPYRSKLVSYFRLKQKWLCPDCQRRLKSNPLRILDCQNSGCKDLISQAPQLVDDLCPECQSHFVKVLEYLDEANVIYKLNPYLVRGLDYYTRTVFEIWPERPEVKEQKQKKEENEQEGEDKKEKEIIVAPGPQSALGGGGRYDTLVESLGGRPSPAIGVAYGLERIIQEIKIQKVKIPKTRGPQIFLAQIGEAACRRALKLFEDLRQQGIKVVENLGRDSLKAQMEMANKLGVKLTLILGQQEVLDKTIIIRDMHTGNQEVVDQGKIAKELKKRLA
ncbi:histidine--tRNA ligase [Patescibacteria group bacterium]|nr:histidine--tRNA ligase [Patescibacteria group bacterium]